MYPQQREKNDFLEDMYTSSVYGCDEDEICWHCEWNNKVFEKDPPCRYCCWFDIQALIPEDFDYEKLRREYGIDEE